MKPFGCPVTILNNLDHLGKFDEKSDDGFFIGYSITSKAFRVLNIITRFVEENLHITFLEDKPNVAGIGPNWMFDIDTLTMLMNYQSVFTRNQTNGPNSSDDEVADDARKKSTEVPRKENGVQDLEKEVKERLLTLTALTDLRLTTGSTYVYLGGSILVNVATLPNVDLPTDPLKLDLEDTVDIGIFSGTYDDEVEGVEADFNNLKLTTIISPIPTTRIHKDHPKEKIIGDPLSARQTRRMTKITQEHAMVKGLEIVDLPKDKHAIGTKWVYRNKKDERGIVVRNKARLVAHGYTQKEGVNYDKVFAHVARIEAIRLFLAYASFMGIIVYQMDVKSAFLYGTIEEEVYVCQPLGFEDPHFPNKDKGDILLVQVYVDDIFFVSTKKSLCTGFEGLMHKKFQMSSIGELTFFLGLQVMQKDDGILISQDKYVVDILKKFDFSLVKIASTLIETIKALLKDEEVEDVDVHLYRLMIGSLMYLTASRPDIMLDVCACARFQVTPKISHLYVVKRMFRYSKGQPKLGLWYPRDSPFDLEAFLDSDYAGGSLDRKSTIGGYQFLGKRLISWQCKKQTVVANSTT
nr:hypothetical protein [Tanacetum cinerariifolium]GEX19381.1 hypothetical protein [Tanacetum cinerariifolium]